MINRVYLFLSMVYAGCKLWGRAAGSIARYLSSTNNPTHAEFYRAGLYHRRARRNASAVNYLREAIELEPECEQYQLAYFEALDATGKREEALDKCSGFLSASPNSYQRASTLAGILKAQGRWGLFIEIQERWLKDKALPKGELFHLADAYERMGRLDKAHETFSAFADLVVPTKVDYVATYVFRMVIDSVKKVGHPKLVSISNRLNRWQRQNFRPFLYAAACYRSGACARALGWRQSEADLFGKVARFSPEKEVREFGVGVLFQRYGRWDEARDQYQNVLENLGESADLLDRLGTVLERSFDWASATDIYERAIKCQPTEARYIRLGFCYERRGSDYLEESIRHYEQALACKGRRANDICFMLGRVSIKLGDAEKACSYFSAMTFPDDPDAQISEVEAAEIEAILAQDVRDWRNWYRIARYYQACGDYDAAKDAFFQATMRNSNYNWKTYFGLGLSLSSLGNYESAVGAFMQVRRNATASSVIGEGYRRSVASKKYGFYSHYYEGLPLKPKFILYESFSGKGISCNPYAIFLKALSDQRFSGWSHVWVVDDLAKVPDEFRSIKSIFYVKKESDLYLRCLAGCEYLINNSTFPPYFIRKDGQKYLNTWHGTPLKTLGMDIKDSPFQRANSTRNFIHATHVVSPNKHTTDVLLDRYGARGCVGAQVLESGYPRIDLLLNMSAEGRANLQERMKLNPDMPVVLYAPTYRGIWNDPAIETDKLISDLKQLSSEKYQVVFRGHYFAEKYIQQLDLPVTIAPHSIDSCELLSVVDVLVTDYSSIFYDYLPTNRPIIHYVHDYDEYEQARGMYFGKESFPGEIVEDITDLKEVIDEVLSSPFSPSDRYLSVKNEMSVNEDGFAADRVIDFFFFGHSDEERLVPVKSKDRKSILFYGSPFDANGIGYSALSLIKSIDTERYYVCVVVDQGMLVNSPDRYERLSELQGVDVVIRSSRMCNSFEEEWVVSEFRRAHSFKNLEFLASYKDAFRREFRRIFSDVTFDAVIDFHGYNSTYTSLLAFCGIGNRYVFLHSDMWEECRVRFPFLRSLFSLYAQYDGIVSVSEDVGRKNKENLSGMFGISKDKFIVINNKISAKSIIERSELAPESQAPAFERIQQDSRYKFISVGRLSPEKRHDKLIAAFNKLKGTYDDAALYIVGDGLMRDNIREQITKLGLTDSVHLVGFSKNPFPYVKAADCLVLSSDHEGQPLVLLEALVLGKACLSTDIPGARSILGVYGGGLVENSAEGLAEGMRQAVAGEYNANTFDAEVYEEEVMRKFYSTLRLEHHVH